MRRRDLLCLALAGLAGLGTVGWTAAPAGAATAPVTVTLVRWPYT